MRLFGGSRLALINTLPSLKSAAIPFWLCTENDRDLQLNPCELRLKCLLKKAGLKTLRNYGAVEGGSVLLTWM